MQVAGVLERAMRPVWSSSTGDAPRKPVEAPVSTYAYMEDVEAHCFVCGRHTDHYAEHDDMVDAGTARYDEYGNTYPIPWRWDAV